MRKCRRHLIPITHYSRGLRMCQCTSKTCIKTTLAAGRYAAGLRRHKVAVSSKLNQASYNDGITIYTYASHTQLRHRSPIRSTGLLQCMYHTDILTSCVSYV